jgi:hypothetical protein
MSDDRLASFLHDIAEMLLTTNPYVATVLESIAGSLCDGSIRQLAELAVSHSVERMAILNSRN